MGCRYEAKVHNLPTFPGPSVSLSVKWGFKDKKLELGPRRNPTSGGPVRVRPGGPTGA